MTNSKAFIQSSMLILCYFSYEGPYKTIIMKAIPFSIKQD